ncbi:hypothetical protein MSPP1_000060 [Malassezia sp. CBS 17886]|nr:hypothetical protein MSPP1_000060 [Malassezia sp. CBS 17886]
MARTSQVRGKIVNHNMDGAQMHAREQFGKLSEVLVLENVADAGRYEVSLSQDIADECSQHGYVQRVLVAPDTPAGVRVFVEFTGVAGAYRAVRALDARYLAGRLVRARYYPEDAFRARDYTVDCT